MRDVKLAKRTTWKAYSERKMPDGVHAMYCWPPSVAPPGEKEPSEMPELPMPYVPINVETVEGGGAMPPDDTLALDDADVKADGDMVDDALLV